MQRPNSELVELMATAVDASCTHVYTPGIHRHVQGALAQGATIEEIMGSSSSVVRLGSTPANSARPSCPRNWPTRRQGRK
jgi:alkylhydroperoxidase/carboxymuconolactone decarboxylase family protein YurZ